MNCQKCGTQLPGYARFCHVCGGAVKAYEPNSPTADTFSEWPDGVDEEDPWMKGNILDAIRERDFITVWYAMPLWVRIAGVVTILLFALGVIGENMPATNTNIGSTTTISQVQSDYDSITATTLYNAYEENEIAADKKYNDKRIQIVGKVSSIEKDVWGDAFVALSVDTSWVYTVRCYFNDNQLGSISNLMPGDAVTIIGKCTGRVISYYVDLKNCSLQ